MKNLKRKYGFEIQKKAQELIDTHKTYGLDDDQAKNAAIVTLTIMIPRLYPLEKSIYQKIYNHLTGTACPLK